MLHAQFSGNKTILDDCSIVSLYMHLAGLHQIYDFISIFGWVGSKAIVFLVLPSSC